MERLMENYEVEEEGKSSSRQERWQRTCKGSDRKRTEKQQNLRQDGCFHTSVF